LGRTPPCLPVVGEYDVKIRKDRKLSKNITSFALLGVASIPCFGKPLSIEKSSTIKEGRVYCEEGDVFLGFKFEPQH
jgi:hypothetical protein